MVKSYMESITPESVRNDILERRLAGESLDELVEEFAYLSETEINNIIADLEQ